MAECIDRDELYIQICKKVNNPAIRNWLGSILAESPVEDVAPVKHGKWIHNDDWWEFICTNCRKGIGNIQEYKYCPNCGADMRGNSDE